MFRPSFNFKRFLECLFCKHDDLSFIENVGQSDTKSFSYRSIWRCRKCGCIIRHNEPIYPKGTRVYLILNSGLTYCGREIAKICNSKEEAELELQRRNDPRDWIEEKEVR